MAKTPKELELEIENIIIAIGRIIEKKARLDIKAVIEEAESCIKEGLIKDYSIKITAASLKIVAYGEDFARFVIWDKSAEGVLTLRNKGVAE